MRSAGSLLERAERLPGVGTLRRALARFIELEGFDRAMALAGQIFAALMPLLIVLGSVSPNTGGDVSDVLIDEFNLSGDTADTLRAAVGPTTAHGIGILGGVVLLISALSFTRAMQRLYYRAWRRRPIGLRANAFGLAWLFVFAAFVGVQPGLVSLFDGLLGTIVAFALSFVLWLLTPWLLLGRVLPWRMLAPQALFTAIGVLIYEIGSAIYMPGAVASAALEFGFIGIAFATVSWLFGFALIIVSAAALGSVVMEPRQLTDP